MDQANLERAEGKVPFSQLLGAHQGKSLPVLRDSCGCADVENNKSIEETASCASSA